MPLVRYEVRCEHSLANPELYRTAGQDDSEGLLEGVAMAGLVGIVRQLGDLAEFAAEIFHDLHDDIMTMVARGRDLKARVARLEVDLPAVEKALLAESSQFEFAYSEGSKWRAPLPMDQNLCVQGELPRFVRNFYDDCRGPPRLFLLDKFDEAGRGACVKRYTDPTFFRLSWAASLLMKAERQRREREAELLKKNTEAADNAGSKIYARERLSSALFENLEGFTGDFTPELRSRRLDCVFEIPTEGVLTPDGLRSPEEPRSPERRMLPQVAEGPVLAPLKISAKDIENAKLGRRVLKSNDEELSDDESSDAEYYVDALTTMGSDPDSEPGSRTRWEVDSIQSRFAVESEAESLNHSVLKAHVEAHRHTPPRKSDEVEDDEDFTQRLGLKDLGTGFDTVREWEDIDGQLDEASGSVEETIELASVASINEDSQNSLAIVPHNVLQEESLPSILPEKLPDKPPDYLSDTISDKFPYALPDKPPDNISDELPVTLSDKLPDTLPDKMPRTLPDRLPDTFSDKLPYKRPVDKLPSVPWSNLPVGLADKGSEKIPDKMPNKPPDDKLPPVPSDKLPDKLSDKTPKNSAAKVPEKAIAKVPEKPAAKVPEKAIAKTPEKPAAKVPEKPTFQSHESVSLLDSFRPSVRVKPIVASIEARAQSQAVENNTIPPSQLAGKDDALKKHCSPVTTPRSRRLWAKDNATQIHSSILQLADMDYRGGTNGGSDLSSILRSRMLESEGNSPEETASSPANFQQRVSGHELKLDHSPSNVSSPKTNVSSVEDEDGYTSSARSSPKGLPNFCALLSPSDSPPRVAEGLMGPPSLFLTNSYFDRSPRAPPITPFLSDSPSVSRSPSLNIKPAVGAASHSPPGNVMLRSSLPPQIIEAPVARDSDKLKNVPATSPRRARENGVLQLEPSRNQPSTLPNPVPRPRTWVDRSESNVAATLQAIRQAAVVASDDDTGSECRSDC